MTDTISNVLKKRDHLVYTRAVWEEASDHLITFLDTDATQAKRAVAAHGASSGIQTPQEIVEKVIEEITKTTSKLDAEIDKLEAQRLNHGKKVTPKKKAAPRKRAVPLKAPRARKPKR
jgi:hypothetical protein